MIHRHGLVRQLLIRVEVIMAVTSRNTKNNPARAGRNQKQETINWLNDSSIKPETKNHKQETFLSDTPKKNKGGDK